MNGSVSSPGGRGSSFLFEVVVGTGSGNDGGGGGSGGGEMDGGGGRGGSGGRIHASSEGL